MSMAPIFEGKTAWFSASVGQKEKDLWTQNGGTNAGVEQADFIFSSNADEKDTKKLYTSSAYMREHLAIFHADYISRAVSARDSTHVILGNYYLPPSKIRKKINDLSSGHLAGESFILLGTEKSTSTSRKNENTKETMHSSSASRVFTTSKQSNCNNTPKTDSSARRSIRSERLHKPDRLSDLASDSDRYGQRDQVCDSHGGSRLELTGCVSGKPLYSFVDQKHLPASDKHPFSVGGPLIATLLQKRPTQKRPLEEDNSQAKCKTDKPDKHQESEVRRLVAGGALRTNDKLQNAGHQTFVTNNKERTDSLVSHPVAENTGYLHTVNSRNGISGKGGESELPPSLPSGNRSHGKKLLSDVWTEFTTGPSSPHVPQAAIKGIHSIRSCGEHVILDEEAVDVKSLAKVDDNLTDFVPGKRGSCIMF